MTTVTGMGSWPGTDVRETLRLVRDTVGALGDDSQTQAVTGLPYLPELPARGPGADLVARGLGLLVDLPVDLQPSGWRIVDRPGHDLGRTRAFLREDLDELAEAYDGWTGPLKVQVAGPWTLAASTWMPRGERVAGDPGAARDLVDSLAEGVREHLAAVRRLVPGADVVLQLDEPSLPAVLAGHLPTASGYGVVRAIEPAVVLAGLQSVLAASSAGSEPDLGSDAGAPVAHRPLVHCCSPDVPLPLLRRTGADLAVDTSLLGPRGWEGVAVGIEEGMTLYAGCVPTAPSTGPPRAQDVAAGLVRRWHELGLATASLGDLVVSPACGLSGITPEAARSVQQVCIDVARELAERVSGGAASLGRSSSGLWR